MRHLNNKGYMLVEIILAFAIAMGVMYFLMELTIKLKNKNDDLLVRTLVATDRAIIYNAIMKDVYGDIGKTNSEIKENYCNKITVSGNTFKYVDDEPENEFTNIVSEYTNIEYTASTDCIFNNVDNGDGTSTISLSLNMKMDVLQMSDENFDVVINYSFDVLNG